MCFLGIRDTLKPYTRCLKFGKGKSLTVRLLELKNGK